jgi:hypothetical protein
MDPTHLSSQLSKIISHHRPFNFSFGHSLILKGAQTNLWGEGIIKCSDSAWKKLITVPRYTSGTAGTYRTKSLLIPLLCIRIQLDPKLFAISAIWNIVLGSRPCSKQKGNVSIKLIKYQILKLLQQHKICTGN